MGVSTSPDRTLNYAFLLGGVVAAIFGVILLVNQEGALQLLVILLGLWWLIHGAFMVFAVFVDNTDAGWKLALGLLGVIAGIMVLSNPGAATEVLTGVFGIFLGVLGILIGVASLVGAFRGGGFGAGVFGVVSVLIGVLILLNAQFSTEVLIYIFAALLLIDGVAGIYLGIKSNN